LEAQIERASDEKPPLVIERGLGGWRALRVRA
jgi:hypothetical protein